MPDIKTALTTALTTATSNTLSQEINAWDEEETTRTTAKRLFPVRNNVARETFNMVKTNPGLPAMQYVEMLNKKGFKESSTTSILSQLVRTGQVARNDVTRTLVVAQPEYTPIKNLSKAKPQATPRKQRKVEEKKAGNTHQSSVGIAALKNETAEPKGVTSIILQRNWTPESVIDKLTLPQAKQLFEALSKYFK